MQGYNEKLLDNMISLTTFVVPSALVLRFFPPFTHPVISYVTHFFNRIYNRRVLKVLGPYIEQQISILSQQIIVETKTLSRNDILTWLITDALRRNESREGLIDRITYRVFIAIFAAMETTTMTISHCLFDICASDDPQTIWESLAAEGQRVLSTPIDLASVNGLIQADSALKETLRLRTSVKALATQVTAPRGLYLQGYNERLPYGARLAVSAWGIHRDKAVYGPDADAYDAFRFSRPVGTIVSGHNTEKATIEAEAALATNGSATTDPNGKVNLMVSATENYLPFGMGRHACPGRYFAAAELKLFLAYLAVHYDLKLGEKGRPGFVSIGHFPIPPLSGRLMIKRKIPALVTTTA